MIVTIQEGQQTAVDDTGKTFDIDGIQITKAKENGSAKVYYDKNSSYFKAVAAANTISRAYKTSEKTIMLI